MGKDQKSWLRIQHFQNITFGQKVVFGEEKTFPPVFFVLEQLKTNSFDIKPPLCGGVVAVLEGDVCQWKNGKISRTIHPLDTVSFKSTDTPKLEISILTSVAGLFFVESQNKGSLYPAYFNLNEELQFPVAGYHHFLFVVSGEVEWFDRERGNSILLKKNELVQITKTNLKKEYLNLKVVGRSSRSILLWGVIHNISDH